MLEWVRKQHGKAYDRELLFGDYKFLVLIGDFVDGNGGFQNGQNMWPAVQNVFGKALATNNTHWPITIAGTPGNHDYKGRESTFGQGTWEGRGKAVDFLGILEKNTDGTLPIPGADHPLSSYREFKAGDLTFVAVFIGWLLPQNQKEAIEQFIKARPKSLIIVLVHFRDECLSWTLRKHKNCFTLWEGHQQTAIRNDGGFAIPNVDKIDRANAGSAHIIRADWQEQPPWGCTDNASNMPQHPIFMVMTFEVNPDSSRFTMYSSHVQAWDPNNPCYKHSRWNAARARIQNGPEVLFKSHSFNFTVSEYI